MKKWIVIGTALSFSSLAWAHQGHDHGHQHHAGHHGSVAAADFDHAQPDSTIVADKCWIRLLPGSVPSAAYFTMHNQGQQEAVLVAARSPAYADVMVHETTHKEGMSHMGHTPRVPVAAGQTVGFEPGGLHIMLEQAVAPLKVGDTAQLELLFEGHRKTQVTCELRSPKTQSY